MLTCLQAYSACGGDADDKPFTFTAGLQSHLACQDLHFHHQFTRMLGLGGKHYIDYCPNARKPKLQIEQDDYVNFGCKPMLPVLHVNVVSVLLDLNNVGLQNMSHMSPCFVLAVVP